MPSKESPEEHVRASTSRQKKAAQSIRATAKEVAETAAQKAAVLATATELLSNRVVTLADAVQTNNYQIEEFRKELNRKPDDVELKFVEQQAVRERRKFFRFAIGMTLVAALISGYVAYDVANRLGKQRCEINAQNISTLVGILDTPQLRDQYASQIADLRSNRNDCE